MLIIMMHPSLINRSGFSFLRKKPVSIIDKRRVKGSDLISNGAKDLNNNWHIQHLPIVLTLLSLFFITHIYCFSSLSINK